MISLKKSGLTLLMALTAALLSCGGASAVVPDGRIGEVGLRFENVRWGWKNLDVDIVNMTDRNVLFGGTMTFLDRYGKTLASASLLPHKINRNSTRRYTGYFVSGSGETARRATRVIWDYGAR
ncbi:MAG: hypothetical protein LBR61_00890 [Synergistaceae bacterium]|jgi:hypothetical protein|nr:hypothetical protein [Synergistaceae bacterium]